MFHQYCSFLYLIFASLTLISPWWKPLLHTTAMCLLSLSLFSSLPQFSRLPSRWFHLNLSSFFTCFWCLSWLILPLGFHFLIWFFTFLHFVYRVLKLNDFHSRAKRFEDTRYLLVPSFGPFPCTILAEFVKIWIYAGNKHPYAHLILTLCSSMSIYGTILTKKKGFRRIYMLYNVMLTGGTFYLLS